MSRIAAPDWSSLLAASSWQLIRNASSRSGDNCPSRREGRSVRRNLRPMKIVRAAGSCRQPQCDGSRHRFLSWIGVSCHAGGSCRDEEDHHKDIS